MKTIYEAFAEKKIEYRILTEDKNESILLDKQRVEDAIELLVRLNYFEEEYWFSSKKGYVYRYAMDEPRLFINEKKYVLLCDIPCHSLTPYNIIPLEKSIQQYAWKYPEVKEGGKILSNGITRYIFRLTECIFRKKQFEDEDCLFFDDNAKVLDDLILRRLLSAVFFSYTDQLLTYLHSREYTKIFKNYLMWKDY